MLFPEAVTFSVCPGLMSLPQEDRKALGALVVLSPSLSFANSPRSLANNFRIDTCEFSNPQSRAKQPLTPMLRGYSGCIVLVRADEGSR
jgi:hypothetical protein